MGKVSFLKERVDSFGGGDGSRTHVRTILARKLYIYSLYLYVNEQSKDRLISLNLVSFT